MAIKPWGRQRGLVLVGLVFLIIVGALLLASMTFLYGSADTEQSLQNSGAQAFIAAESGDQYGVYWLETHYPGPKFLKTGGGGIAVSPAPPLDNPDCPATVTVTQDPSNRYTIQSVVVCTSSGARWTVVRIMTATEQRGRITYNYSSSLAGWSQQ